MKPSHAASENFGENHKTFTSKVNKNRILMIVDINRTEIKQ